MTNAAIGGGDGVASVRGVVAPSACVVNGLEPLTCKGNAKDALLVRVLSGRVVGPLDWFGIDKLRRFGSPVSAMPEMCGDDGSPDNCSSRRAFMYCCCERGQLLARSFCASKTVRTLGASREDDFRSEATVAKVIAAM